MKAGDVVRLRLSPRDVVGVARVCEQAGLIVQGASLSQYAALALRVLLDVARDKGLIPKEEDDFTAYSSVKARCRVTQDRKLAVSRFIDQVGVQAEIGDATGISMAATKLSRTEIRMNELIFKAEHDPLNFSAADREELADLTAQIREGTSG